MNIIKLSFIIILLVGASVLPLGAELLIPLKEALDSAFPGTTSVDKITIILDDDEAAQVEDLSKIKLDSKIHIFYEFSKGSEILGYGIVDTHLLRTRSETVLYLLDKNGKLFSTEILAFFEPPDYMPPEKWLNLFKNKTAQDEMRIGKQIPNITGATITAHEFSRHTRKILAIYKVIFSNNN